MIISEVNRPDTSSSPDIEYAMKSLVLWYRSSKQFPAEYQLKFRVLQIQTIALNLVVWKCIGSILEMT